MNTVWEILEYTNLERIWLERVEREVREGQRKVTKNIFELHVIRQTESSATYEDTVDYLSESEREVTRLVFSLSLGTSPTRSMNWCHSCCWTPWRLSTRAGFRG